MFSKKIIVLLLVLLLTATGISTAIALTEKEQLGKSIFLTKIFRLITTSPALPVTPLRLDGQGLIR